MHRWKQVKKCILLFIFSLSLTACESLHTGAENIQLVSGFVPKQCQYRGPVDSGLAKAPLVSHKQIEEMQSVTLKNQALTFHANVVLVTHHESTYYLPYVPPLFPWVVELKTHQMRGEAYYCDSKAMAWVAQHPTSVSDVYPNAKIKYQPVMTQNGFVHIF